MALADAYWSPILSLGQTSWYPPSPAPQYLPSRAQPGSLAPSPRISTPQSRPPLPTLLKRDEDSSVCRYVLVAGISRQTELTISAPPQPQPNCHSSLSSTIRRAARKHVSCFCFPYTPAFTPRTCSVGWRSATRCQGPWQRHLRGRPVCPPPRPRASSFCCGTP